MPTPIDETELTKGLVDQGLMIEAGWVGFKFMAMHPRATQYQIDEMRIAFFAGAHHVFASIMTMLDPDAEPTEKDLRRMAMIQSELDEYIKQFKAKYNLS